MSHYYCGRHGEYPRWQSGCPDCRREAEEAEEQRREAQEREEERFREAQERDEERFREAQEREEARADAARERAEERFEEAQRRADEREYRRFNPGDYKCPSCLLNTLLKGASACPVCTRDVPRYYWVDVQTAEEEAARAEAIRRAKAAEEWERGAPARAEAAAKAERQRLAAAAEAAEAAAKAERQRLAAAAEAAAKAAAWVQSERLRKIRDSLEGYWVLFWCAYALWFLPLVTISIYLVPATIHPTEVYVFAAIPAVNWLFLLVTAMGIEKGPFPASWLGQCLLVAIGAGVVFAIITRPKGNHPTRVVGGGLLVAGSIWLMFGGWFIPPPERFLGGGRSSVSSRVNSRLKEAMDKAPIVRGRPGESVTIIAPADGSWVKLYGKFSAPYAHIYWGNETTEIRDGPGRSNPLIPRGGWIAVRSAGVKPVRLKVTFEK